MTTEIQDDAIKQLATQMVESRGHGAYSKLCDEWKIEPNPNLERLFKAGMATGVFMALQGVMDADV